MIGRCFIYILILAFPIHAIIAQNLVQNPGFEAGTNNWLPFQASLVNSTLTTHSGTNAGAVSADGFGGIGQFLNEIPQPRQTYLWSAWIKAVSGPSDVHLRFSYRD